jgi:hypothetical protein
MCWSCPYISVHDKESWKIINCKLRRIRASPVVLHLWSCRVKLDEEKSKYASLAHQLGPSTTESYQASSGWCTGGCWFTVAQRQCSQGLILHTNGTKPTFNSSYESSLFELVTCLLREPEENQFWSLTSIL